MKSIKVQKEKKSYNVNSISDLILIFYDDMVIPTILMCQLKLQR